MLLRELIPPILTLLGVRKKNGNGNTGEKPVEFWQLELRKAISEALQPQEKILEKQTIILERIADLQRDLNAEMKHFRKAM